MPHINTEVAMKKIRLDTSALRVDSFVTDGVDGRQGTVHGHATPISVCRTCGGAECEVTSVQSCPLPMCVTTPR
jgi:hypothetical protein